MKKLNVFNILISSLVLICTLVVSFNHTLALFRSGGFHNGLELAATIGAEATFIMGALNLVVSRMKGFSPGKPAMLGFFLGVALVSWSNVAAGLAYGVTGVLLGLSTPVSLIVSEAILSHAFLKRSKVESRVEDEVEKRMERMEEMEKEVERMENRSTFSMEAMEEHSTMGSYRSTDKMERMERMEYHSNMSAPFWEKYSTANSTMMDKQENHTASVTESVEDDPSYMEDMAILEEMIEVESRVEQEKQVEEHSKAESKMESKMENEVESEADPSKVENNMENEMESKVENNTNGDGLEEVIECALHIQQKTGKLPGRKKLMEVAGCSEWLARKALADLKKTG